MTEKERKQYKSKQYEIRMNIDNFVCQYPNCTMHVNTMGHRIKQDTSNKKVYGWEIIQHNFNITVSCSQHNSYFDLGIKTEKIKRLVNLVQERGNERLTSEVITRIINE
jgi:hypothetical protein